MWKMGRDGGGGGGHPGRISAQHSMHSYVNCFLQAQIMSLASSPIYSIHAVYLMSFVIAYASGFTRWVRGIHQRLIDLSVGIKFNQ